MGNQTSSGSAKGKKVVTAKVNMAVKTGVLNLSEQDLKAKSSVWVRLTDDEILTKLKSLDISRNTLKAVPAEIQGLLNLKTLIVASCELTSLVDLRQMSRLVDLQASNNSLGNGSLEGFPQSIERCDLSVNIFVSFPLELATMVNLKELNLSGNSISTVDGISVLSQLTLLYLDNNRLAELPLEIGELRGLKLISLKFNFINKKAVSREGQSLPAVLFTNTSLDRIDLHGNEGLRKSDVEKFDGIEHFLERRKQTKDKAFKGGGLVDMTLFGID